MEPSAILCERCGYDLTDLEHRLAIEPAAPCPECGKPIVESLPERREGSAWQRRRSIGPWMATHARTLRRPRSRWAEVRAERGTGLALALVTCGVVGAAWGAVVAMSHTAPHRARGLEAGIGVGLLAAAAAWVVLPAMCWIERFGLLFYARRHGWRTTPAVAWSVIGHASIGWALAPIMAAVIDSLAGEYINAAPLAWTGQRMWESWVLLFVMGPLIAGMLGFETLVYIGWRAMRYANHPRAAYSG